MIYAISDLHLSFSTNKPMNIFGDIWDNHYNKIKTNWDKKVKDDDLVLIPGDISWAMSLEEALYDFKFISSLKGTKVFIKGNHDYWWSSISKVRSVLGSSNCIFLQNDSLNYNGYSICGTRGWLCPNNDEYSEKDEKIYLRELKRLELSLESANQSNIIVMMHYPPAYIDFKTSGFTELFKYYNVKKVVYGHLHGEDAFEQALIGQINGIDYELVSADYLNFNLKDLI